MKLVAQALSKLLLIVGAVILAFGDKALKAFWKFHFVATGLLTMVCGIVLISAGAAIQSAIKKPQRNVGDTSWLSRTILAGFVVGLLRICAL